MKTVIYIILFIISIIFFIRFFGPCEENIVETNENFNEVEHKKHKKRIKKSYLQYDLDKKLNPYYEYQEPYFDDCSNNLKPIKLNLIPDTTMTSKQFRDDFFNFRNHTFNDTSQRIDPVDNINNFRNGVYGMTIKDIYDRIVQN